MSVPFYQILSRAKSEPCIIRAIHGYLWLSVVMDTFVS